MKTTSSTSDGFSSTASAADLRHILDSLDALVYVSDMDTYQLLFFNAYGRALWGDPARRKCWQVLQQGQAGPCSFCTNDRLLDERGRPGPAVVWEFQNTVNGRWYQCRDQAIEWSHGQLVRVEIATDITERKELELELIKARQDAERLAYTDELTGLYNRRAFFELSGKMIEQARRRSQSVGMVLLDLDHFKQINDTCGHNGGDEVLKSVAAVLRRLVRHSDIVCRFGGEEFAIALVDSDLEQVVGLAERLRQALPSCPGAMIVQSDKANKVTASFGVIVMAAQKAELGDLLSSADRAMYRAKAQGRNRIEIARPGK